MLYTVLVGLVFLAFFTGYFMRETINILLVIKNTLKDLKVAQDKEQPPSTDFAEPMTRTEMAAMLEEEKIKMLNPNG